MTQEDKELLLKDLTARLPHGVKLGFYASATKQTYICTLLGLDPQEDEPVIAKTENGSFYMLAGHVKPYLFPLSSMTEEMLEELNANGFFKYRDTIANVSHLESKNGINEEIYTYIDIESISFLIEFFHSHHIDYRGLIPKGLALDATGLNIY